MIVSRETLLQECEKLKIKLSDEEINQLDEFASLLLEWNKNINLTRITEPEEITVKHFVDSLTLLWAVDIKKGSRVIDIGTGAGFPSVPVKIVRKDIDITMMDSINKKLNFIREATDKLGLDANIIHARAEELAQQKQYREQFDYATARAVANLRDLSEYCLPFVKVGGSFVALKGPLAQEEIDSAKIAIKKLGGKISQVKNITLSDKGERNIIIIEKISQTPTQYPRSTAQIKKIPLC
ncbi:MAG: 16S rRNA (guanine(527)-N(7))-methyltransferase RsmG [Clostridiales bacterium]|nr:16S rRNA (guanine(527)-N(7))-methyltransferase RsmG [Clostridiales bacterium]